jgi:hypothetical protein
MPRRALLWRKGRRGRTSKKRLLPKKINKFGYPRLLQRMRDRFLNRRSYRFYFLCVSNELLLYIYMRDQVRVSRFSFRIAKMLLMHSMTTLISEPSLSQLRRTVEGRIPGLRISHFALQRIRPANSLAGQIIEQNNNGDYPCSPSSSPSPERIDESVLG